MKIDCHVHMISAAGEAGSPLSHRVRRTVSHLVASYQLGLPRGRSPEATERAYVELIAGFVRDSELDRAVLLAFDRVHGPDGSADPKRTYLHVPNDVVRDVCARHPDRFLFGASVHPHRPDALEELARVREQGAVLVKLLPNSQGFDPADPRHASYYRKLAELGLPLLIHCGFEHTVPVIDQTYGEPNRLRPALDEGPTVIVAHAGTAGLMHRRETFGQFLSLLVEYPNCFGDSSALGNFWRTRYLFQLLDPGQLERRYGVAIEDPPSRLIHGSDTPVPITPFAFAGKVSGKERRRLKKLRNPLQMDIELKRQVGLSDDCLTRGAEVLGLGD